MGGDHLTVLLGQLYFSKISWARSSPPSVNIIIILLQLALGALVSWGAGAGREEQAAETREGGGREGKEGRRKERKRGGQAKEVVTHIHNNSSASVADADADEIVGSLSVYIGEAL